MLILVITLGLALWVSLAYIVKLREDLEPLRLDSLTGLPRRSPVTEKTLRNHVLKAERNRWSSVVMFIDIDRLKPINDQFGHHAGDALLKKATEIMRSCLRPYDPLVRWGGDEFVALITFNSMGLDPVTAVRKTVVERLNNCFEMCDHEHEISASIGLASAESSNIMKAINEADAEMYAVKKEKKISR